MITMTSKENENFFGVCCCCSNYGYLKSMWATHDRQGKSEVYGKMLGQCFALTLSLPESENKYKICKDCIHKLRAAFNFKKLVIASRLKKNKFNASEDSSNLQLENSKEFTAEMDIKNSPKTELCEDVEFLEEYEAIKCLEDDEFEETPDTTETPTDNKDSRPKRRPQSKNGNRKDLYDTLQPRKRKSKQQNVAVNNVSKSGKKLKWPKKLPVSERGRTYRQYSDEQLVAAVESVYSGRTTVSAAAQQYGVTATVVSYKLKKVQEDPDALRRMTNTKRFKFMIEIKEVLQLTNMTPFASRASFAACLYCHETPRDIVQHTREKHTEHRIDKIELCMRPLSSHEILRVDTRDLQCTECDLPFTNWNTMLSHLQSKHELELDHVYTHLIPCHLPYTCALCHRTFPSFLILDTHMNFHYANHACPKCGANFMTRERLKAHSKSHKTGKFPCTLCRKIFTLKSALRTHLDVTHKLGARFKCPYCEDKFFSAHTRHQHLLERHEEKIVPINCDYCDKVFTCRQYFTEHVRKVHIKYKQHACTECDSKFIYLYELKNHMLKHGK